MFRSIRWQLVVSYVLLILLTVALVGAVALRLVVEHVERQEIEHLTTNATAVAQQARNLMWPLVSQPELQDLVETSAFLGNAQVRILDTDHRVVADSEFAAGDGVAWLLVPQGLQIELPEGFPDLSHVEFSFGRPLALPSSVREQLFIFEQLPPEEALTLLRWQEGAWRGGLKLDVVEDVEQLQELAGTTEATPRSDRVVSVPIGPEEQPLGYVQISKGPDFVTEALATTRRAFIYAAAGAVLMAVVVGLLMSRSLAAPLRDLAQAAGKMGEGDLSIRAPAGGKDEIGQLASQFNRMAQRLEASFGGLAAERDALRRFIADASHELRTPITALRSFNDLLLGAAADDAAARAEFLAESQVQLERMEWITHNLLDLSRLDAGLVSLELTTHDVGELIEAAVSPFRALAREKQISLSVWPLIPPASMRCDRARIEMALSNLVDNALKFTPPGGQVEVGCERRAEAVRLWVWDNGSGIEPEDLPHLFERFYRGKSSEQTGSGLGLTIVHSIVKAHGGSVSLASEVGAGSRFEIVLPQTPEPA